MLLERSAVNRGQQKTIEGVENLDRVSDEEIVRRYEEIPNRNVFVRKWSEDQERQYSYKQTLALRYYYIKLEEGKKLGEQYGILDDLPYVCGDLPYIALEIWQWEQCLTRQGK